MSFMDELNARIAEACESPIEEKLAEALFAVPVCVLRLNFTWSLLDGVHGVQFWREDEKPKCVAAIVFQPPLELEGVRYRPDFMLVAYTQDGSARNVDVECDGHEFHSVTKEQASRDRARDRVFQRAGVVVARFTGSDIHRDATSCAIEAWRMAGLNRSVA